MEFKDIAKRAQERTAMPSSSALAELTCYTAMQHLYEMLRTGAMSMDTAKKQVKEIKAKFKEVCYNETYYANAVKKQTEVIKMSEELRNQIRKAQTDEAKLQYALELIRQLTGDVTIK